MLSIPDSIKALFRTDGIHKNFRVHFPNGEYPDITNENVVQESLKFTESLCSQDQFRFGLAEASVLEFETVGIGNMYGMTIEASIEIDTTSLSAADISAIQAGTWDGTLVLVGDSDIGFGFFRVPLGVFRVEDCPRNHGAMAHRQVTAYSYVETAADLLVSPYEDWNYNAAIASHWTKDYSSADDFINSNLAWSDPSILDGYTRTLIPQPGATSNVDIISTPPSGSPAKSAYVRVNYYALADGQQTQDTLYSVDDVALNTYADPDDVIAEIEAFFEGTYSDQQREKMRRTFVPQIVNNTFGYTGALARQFVLNKAAPMIYASPTDPVLIYIPMSVTLIKNIMTQETITLVPNYPVAAYTLSPFSASALPISFSATGWRTIYLPQPVKTDPTFVNALDLSALISGETELEGKYARMDRAGGVTIDALNPSSPIAISADDYSEVWWDEYNVSPIGLVTVSFGSADGEQTVPISIGDGLSAYEMTDNTLLKSLSSGDADTIAAVLSGDFATNAANVGFTPVDMTMRGLPWIEAGDALEITAEDGTVVDTYALRIEMSGIQHLTATVEARGGTIIGEV